MLTLYILQIGSSLIAYSRNWESIGRLDLANELLDRVYDSDINIELIYLVTLSSHTHCYRNPIGVGLKSIKQKCSSQRILNRIAHIHHILY